MKKTLLFLPLLVWLATTFVACEEISEPGKYADWRKRNEAYIDSLANVTRLEHQSAPVGAYVTTAAQAEAMVPGKLYAIKVESASTSSLACYVYCKKLVANPGAERPNFAGYHSTVNTYYYGTLINGESFDGNFTGYTGLDKTIALPPTKVPTEFDDYSTFKLNSLIAGWTTALQFMAEGERWMLYIPWAAGYGSNDQGLIKAYSTLIFDVVLDSIEE